MAATPLTYFAQFRNADGTLLTGADGQTWFAVSGVSGASEQALDIGAASPTSSGAGSLIELPTSLTVGSDPALATLFKDLAAGTSFEQVEIAGYGGHAVLVQDTVLKGATVSADTLVADGTTIALSSSDQVDRSFSATGAQTSVEGWNAATGKADTGTDTVTGTPGYAPMASSNAVPDAVPDDTLTYFVQFRAADGTVVAAADGQTWFAVAGVAVPAVRTTGSGSGGATVTLDAASFTVTGAALPPLLQQEGSDAALTVELAGYDGTSATAALRSDILLKSGTITSIAASSDGSDTVDVRSADVVQTDFPAPGSTNPLGATAGYDTATSQPDTSAMMAASPLGSPGVTSGPALTYYVRFITPTGTILTGDGGDTWFAVQNLSGGTTHVAGSTTLTFDPLQLTLAPDSILDTLFARQALGTVTSIEVAGYTAAGALDEDDVYGLALPTSLRTNADGTETLSIAAGEASQTQYGKGLLGQPQTQTSSWSTAGSGSTALSNTSPPSAPSTPPAVPAADPALTYYVQVRNQGGVLLTGTGGETWFAVTDVSFATDNTISGTRVGQESFGGLSFTLGADPVLPRLFGIETAGVGLASVELAGYASDGSGSRLVTDDLFKQLNVSGFSSQSDGTANVSLTATDLLQTSNAPDSSGVVARIENGWNFNTNSVDNTTAIPDGGNYGLQAGAAKPSVAAEPGPLTYFVRFTPSDSTTPLAAADGSSWFAISGFSLRSSGPSAVEGTGLPHFLGASFTLDNSLLQPMLLVMESNGTTFGQVEIAGYDTSAGTPVLVEDHLLDTVGIADLQSGLTNALGVTLQYGTDVEQSYTTAADGTLSPPVSAGYDAGTKMTTTTPTEGATAPPTGEPAGVPTPEPLTYFVSFSPYDDTGDGGLFTSSGTPTFYSVADVSFDVTETLSIGSQGSGAGAGKVSFNPLSFTLPAGSPLLPTLLALEGTGTPFKTVELAGYDTDDSSALRTFDDHFELAAVSSIETNPDGTETVSLEYGALRETSAGQMSSDVVETDTGAWNRVTNTPDDSAYTIGSTAALTAEPADGNACYCAGTLIAVPGGERPVEELAAGDLVLTADGTTHPVVWIGRRSFAGRFVRSRAGVLPILFRAGSLGDGLPRRDLQVSPEHCMLLDGVLIPAKALVNGQTIITVPDAASVHYIHVELAEHGVLLAEGAPSESYADGGNRMMFHNGYEVPVQERDTPLCAPRVESGWVLEAIRQRLAAIAGSLLAA